MKNYAWWLLILCFLVPGAGAGADEGAEAVWQLERGQLLDKVLLEVVQQYFDPDRFDPPKMLRSALEEMEREVVPIQVVFHEDRDEFVVRAGQQEETFKGLKPIAPWDVASRLKEVFRFLVKALATDETKPKDVERAAVRGILDTLDPHSMILEPEMVDELNIATSGEFGGLGIKITTDRRPPCNGSLTIVEVFDGTPAAEAGLKAGDRITRIGEESTVNITTQGAAERLRGPSGSHVTVWVERAGESGARRYDLAREQIHVNSVTSKMLAGQVGYVKLSAFQRNSYADFRKGLLELHQAGMKGLILDLRDNPGGLLELAVMIADTFLYAGTIVTTAGRSKETREVRNATSGGTESDSYPIVVLVNQESASAAEILAAALQNHGRVLVVGEQTFGKGSVQIVEQLSDGEDLKLTVAEYLTPGDFSIQALGVRPDVGFQAMSLDRKDLRLSPRDLIHEKDVKGHLERADRKGFQHETITLDILEPAEDRLVEEEDLRRCIPTDPDRALFPERYALDFARDLIVLSQAATREGLMKDAKAMIEERGRMEEKKFMDAARKLGVDWRPGTNPSVLSLRTTVSVGGKGPVKAGQTVPLRVEVQNLGKEPAYRLRGVTESDNPIFNGLDLILGFIPPGRSKVWTIPVEIPTLVESREDPVKVQVYSPAGPVSEKREGLARVEGQPEPEFAALFQLVDTGGNGDGYLSPGEEATLFVTISNIGKGKTFNTELNIAGSSMTDVGIGRTAVGSLKPGDERTVRFTFKLDQAFTGDKVKIEFNLSDWIPARYLSVKEYLQRNLEFPVRKEGLDVSPAAGSITLVEETPLWAAPDQSRRPIAMAAAGTAFVVEASIDGYMRVSLGQGRSAWVKSEVAKPGGAAKPAYKLLLDAPPKVMLSDDRIYGTDSDSITICGVAEDDEGIRDIYAIAGQHKVFYTAASGAGKSQKLPFEFKAPLEPGQNPIIVVARQDQEMTGHAVLYVRRKGTISHVPSP